MSLKIVSALMTQRRFLPLWVAQTLGAFNDNLFRYALVALATYQGWTVFGLDNQIMVPLAATAFTVPIFANVSAARVTDPAEEQGLLVEQITGRVRWRESVLAMREAGVERFVELGGKVLGPMVGRIDKGATTVSLVTMEDLENFAKENA